MSNDSSDIVVDAEELSAWVEKCRAIARQLESKKDLDGASMMWFAAQMMEEKLLELSDDVGPIRN